MSRQTDDAGGTAIDIAEKIRLLRQRRKLSQRELAEASDLSPNTLSLLERGQTSPTVTTLRKLASALGVDINAFFEPVTQTNIVYTKAEQHRYLPLSQGFIVDLGAGMAEQLALPLLYRLEPGAVSDASSSIHDGQEFAYCLSGQLLYTVDDKPFLLEAGDSILFDGALSHRFQNTGTEVCMALIVWSLPEESAERANAHFSNG